ncbi:hypothetical protein EAO28_05495 [Klebsiella pneumoniae]|uniref:Uncharacterized protein n=1 Tax=Klebsiella pneumoniae TaxID=573 RepID=A0A3P2EFV8_KLEPN|nr:hypothetical protein EAO28_05495 [Klebsiella pneumoniae]
MMSLWDALRMNMMISYQELVRTFHSIRLECQHNQDCKRGTYEAFSFHDLPYCFSGVSELACPEISSRLRLFL